MKKTISSLVVGVTLVLLAGILSYGRAIEGRLDSIEQDVAVIKDRLSVERTTVGVP